MGGDAVTIKIPGRRVVNGPIVEAVIPDFHVGCGQYFMLVITGCQKVRGSW